MDNHRQPASGLEIPADIETASEGYAARFRGPAGVWMLDVQERTVRHLLESAGARSILEVGGGHGQLTPSLVQTGAQVTVQGSDESCRRGVQALVQSSQARFVVGSFLDLPFPDQSFDAVISIRLIMHSESWPRIIAEMCRVARRTVMVDYPTTSPLSNLLFGAKKKLEKNTRTWRSFRHDEVSDAFAEQRFLPAGRCGQFFFPMVIHRTLQLRALSAALEGTTRLLGLNHRWGSPVLARFDRRAA